MPVRAAKSHGPTAERLSQFALIVVVRLAYRGEKTQTDNYQVSFAI